VRLLVAEYFKKSLDENAGFALAVQKVTLGEKDRFRELIILHKLYDLCCTRAAWVAGATQAPVNGEIFPIKVALKKARQEARETTWFLGNGSPFISPFYLGADQLTMTAALALSLMIHCLATIETYAELYAPAILVSPLGSTVILILLVGMGVVWPLYYVLSGRSLMDEIKTIADRARAQAEVVTEKSQELVEDMVDKAKEELSKHGPRRPAADPA
jgi:hypothetical protein